MAPRKNAEQEEPTTDSPATDFSDSGSDVTSNMPSEADEEEIKRFWSTTYEHGLRDPMKQPLHASWELPITEGDMEKLKAGFRSRSMDQKWDMLVEEPDENGNISLHIIRNWLQEEFYILHIVPKSGSNDDDARVAKIQSITWEGNKSGWQCDGEQAKKEAVILIRSHLKCEFETLPRYPTSVFWDDGAYKKLDAE